MYVLQLKKPTREISNNLLRVAMSGCDAHCTKVQLRFSPDTAAARNGSSRFS